MASWGLGALGGGFPMGRQRFEEQYHCYSVAFAEKPHLEVRYENAATRLHMHTGVEDWYCRTGLDSILNTRYSHTRHHLNSRLTERRQDSHASVSL